jgi:membrane-associated phospholipid phosphatase
MSLREIAALTGGAAALALTTQHAKSSDLHEMEREAFRVANTSSDSLNPVVYVLMQAGQFAAIPVTSAMAWKAGRPRLASRLAVAGLAAWLLAKLVKQIAQRDRPDGHIDDVVVRGREWRGLGFPSGHSAVAASLASAAGPDLPLPARLMAWVLVAIVGFSRMYVGAHLPLDTVGGVALGVSAGNAARLALGDTED